MALAIVEEFALSDVGRQRTTNEDSYFEGAPLFAVADGMGGALAGEVASSMAVKTLGEMMDSSWEQPEQELTEIAREANRRIYELAQSDESRQGMGCTLTVTVVRDGEITIAHVGDSRAYRLRSGTFEQLTADHSLVEELVRQGKLTPEEAETHPQRSIITRALGPEPDVDVDSFTHPAKDGDVYLLCSDGLTGMVTDERIKEILEGRESLEQAARALVEAANANGGRDNITVVMFRLGETAQAEEDLGETQVDLTTDDVRAAAAETKMTPVQPTQPTDTQDSTETVAPAKAPDAAGEPRDLTKIGTPGLALEAEGAPSAVEPEREGRDRPPAPPARRGRRWITVVILVLVVAAIVVGLYIGSRQLWFVGSNDNGLLTLYRGVPYELPLGLVLYTEEYVSSVPARSIRPRRRRDRVLDHQLRSRGDAVDLIRQYERARVGAS